MQFSGVSFFSNLYTLREVTLITGRGGYGKVGGGYRFLDPQKGEVTDFYCLKRGGYRFFWKCIQG